MSVWLIKSSKNYWTDLKLQFSTMLADIPKSNMSASAVSNFHRFKMIS